jgi:L,D-peptidoglycan transpeptidase YkuD (ErfK/YbiS/YcfS/YnhG family)
MPSLPFVCALISLAIGLVPQSGAADRLIRRARPASSQMVVTIASGWNSSSGELQCFDRTRDGWVAVFDKPIPVLLGRNGLAWGRGLRGQGEGGKHKHEGDGRAPAGVFKIGKIYTYDSKLPPGASYPFRTVTKWDAWVDDPKLAEYNRHVVVDPKRVPAWFEKQKMRHGDFAYRWLIEVRHNADPPKPGSGSAIFFHTRRGPGRKTAGCTTMSSANLIRVMRWLRTSKSPQYTLLPKSEYEERKKSWRLPEFKK